MAKKRKPKFLPGELLLAELWAASRLRPSGQVEHIDDGKTDLFIKLRWNHLVELLAGYGRVIFRGAQTKREAGR